MCGNPALPAATPVCSDSGWEDWQNADGSVKSIDGYAHCNYQGERTTFATAQALCASHGLEQGYPTLIRSWKAGPCAEGIATRDYRMWAAQDCGIRAKIDLGSGDVAIVHGVLPDHTNVTNVEPLVGADTLNFFSVPWDQGARPTESDCIAATGCTVHGGGYCICDTDATDSIVFGSAAELTSVDDVAGTLHVGAADPASFDAGTYVNLGECGVAGLTVHSPAGSTCTDLRIDTIFSYVRNSKSYFVKNSRSEVSISGTAFKFRNPVQFISLADPEDRDAYHETEEVLDSLFLHPSHAPFMALRMIQRFGNSNPSPGFVERVSSAYAEGTYGQFGSGEYGDLGALVAAILLDDESRRPVLDEDQSSGHLREPLVKVLSFFRSMGLGYDMPLSVPTLFQMEGKIGQGSFEYPSVFSFFLPEFSPPGGVALGGLVAPEAMVLQVRRIAPCL